MKALEKYPQMETQLDQTLQALEGVSQEELEWKPCSTRRFARSVI